MKQKWRREKQPHELLNATFHSNEVADPHHLVTRGVYALWLYISFFMLQLFQAIYMLEPLNVMPCYIHFTCHAIHGALTYYAKFTGYALKISFDMTPMLRQKKTF